MPLAAILHMINPNLIKKFRMQIFASNKSHEYFSLALIGRGHMVYLIICSLLSLVLVLFLKSLFRGKGSFAGSQSGIENPEVKKGVFDITSTAISALDSGCKAYVIQSLYSKEFILPEDAGLKYKFRAPLPSFDEGYMSCSIAPESYSRSSSDIDSKAIDHGHNNVISGT
jgi:hypothetical protein